MQVIAKTKVITRKDPNRCRIAHRCRITSARNGKILVSGMVVVGVFAAALAALFLFGSPKHEADSERDVDVIKTVSITTGTIGERTVQRTIETSGSLHAFEDITISAKVEGHVTRLNGEVADRIEPSATLLEIDPTMYDLAVRQSERTLQVDLSRMGFATLPEAESDILKVDLKKFDILSLPAIKLAESKRTFARSNAQRMQTLAQSRSISAEELESATADLRSNEAEYENQMLMAKSSLATISMRQEALRVARQQQADAIVRAPVPRQAVPFQSNPKIYAIAARRVSEGTYVRTGTELFRLVIDSTLRLKVAVPERYMNEVCDGLSVRVTASAIDEPILGKVTRIVPVIDPLTRAFQVEIELDNTRGHLKPGGFAKASIITKEESRAIVAPIESIVSFAGVTKLFIVDEGNAKEVQVRLGAQGETWVEIVDPVLKVGEAVVTSGQSALAQGTPVKVRTNTEHANEAPLSKGEPQVEKLQATSMRSSKDAQPSEAESL